MGIVKGFFVGVAMSVGAAVTSSMINAIQDYDAVERDNSNIEEKAKYVVSEMASDFSELLYRASDKLQETFGV